MPRKVLIPLVAVTALVVLAGGGAYAYFFSGLRSSPSALALSSPTPTSTAAASAGGGGTWRVASGSLAGYRVKERFAGQSSTHEAVARTSGVTGTVTITRSGDTYVMSAAKITVDLSGLASVDSVAGYNVTNRDRIVQQALDVRSFPTAVFEATSTELPPAAASGQAVTVSVPGKLTIHGVTKDATGTLQLRVGGSTAQVAGSIAITMTDYGVNPPTVGFTTVQPSVTIEVSLNLTQSS